MSEMINQKRLKEVLDYDPATGVFTWRVELNARGKVGDPAGCNSWGYRVIRIDGRLYGAHRLVWLYVHGRWPDAMIDHVNGDRSDNRIENLREANSVQNAHNAKRPNLMAIKGFFPREENGGR